MLLNLVDKWLILKRRSTWLKYKNNLRKRIACLSDLQKYDRYAHHASCGGKRKILILKKHSKHVSIFNKLQKFF